MQFNASENVNAADLKNFSSLVDFAPLITSGNGLRVREMQVSEFLVVAGLCCIILPWFTVAQNNEVSSRNPAIALDGKVTVNFGDLVIEVKPPQGREGIVNTQPIYEQWENVDDVTYWESIYGSMDNIPAFEDLPDIPGETVELKYVKEWDEVDPEEKPSEITNKDQSRVHITNSPSRDDRSPSSTTEFEMTTKNSRSDRCERINPLFPTLKSLNRQKREISISQEEQADAEEARKSEPNRKRKGRTLSLLQCSAGKSRLKSNWRSDYLLNKYGRKSFRPYEYERGIGGSSVDDCTDDYGITGAATSAKFVDSAINAVELVKSGIAKTNQVITGTIVNGARQLAEAKHGVIDLGQEATQANALGSLNNAAADCTEEGIGVTMATNIGSGLEVVGNSVLDTNSGIINVGTDTGVPVQITASLDADTKAGVDTVVGSVLDNDSAVGAEIISNAVGESNIAITVDEDIPEKITVAENNRQIDLPETEIVGETLVAEKIVGETSGGEDIVGETSGAEEIVGETLVPEDFVGETSRAEDIVGETSDAEDIVGETSDAEDIVGETLVPEENVGGTLILKKTAEVTSVPEEIVERTLAPEEAAGDATMVKSSVLESGIGKSSHVGEVEVVSGAETLLGSALKLNAKSDAHISSNAEISIDSKVQVKDIKDRMNEPGRRVLESRDSSYECADSAEDDRIRDLCMKRRNYHEFEGEQEYRRMLPHRRIYRPNSQHYYGRPRSGIHEEQGINTSVDTGIGASSNRGSISSITAASADLNANLEIGSSGIHADTGIHSSLNSAVNINSDHHSRGLHNGAKSSLVDSHLDTGRSQSNYGTNDYDRERWRHPEECDSAEDIYDFDSEEYQEFKRRFLNPKTRGHSLNSGIRKSLDTGVGIDANHGSIHTATAASIDVDSNLNVGTSTSGVHTESGIHGSLNTGLNINSGVHGEDLHAGIKSSVNADSHLDISHDSSRTHRIHDEVSRNRDFCDCEDYEDYLEYRRRYPDMREPDYQEIRSRIHGDSGIHVGTGTHASLDPGLDINSRHRAAAKSSLDLDSHPNIGRSELRTLEKKKIYGDFDRNEDVCECEDSEEYREYRRRYPSGRFRPDNRGLHNSGTHASAGIHPSLDSGVEIKTGFQGGGVSSGVHASSGIHGSLDTGIDLNSNAAQSHLHAESRAALDAKTRLDVGHMTLVKPNKRYRGYQRGEEISAEYDDYDDERAYGRFSPSRYRDSQRGVNSKIHAASGIHGSVGTEVGINGNSVSVHEASAKASLNLDSHLDIGVTKSAVNSANSQHFPDIINSAIHADAGIHTSLDTDVNALSRNGEIKSSLAVDSHLDVGTRTNGDPGGDLRSEIMEDINGPDGELSEKICEAAGRGRSGFQKHDSCPHSRYEPPGRDRPSYICDNCKKRLDIVTDHFCPNCGEQDDVFRERLPFLSSGTIYHFDGLKRNCKRTTDSSEDIELRSETTCGLKRYINLDANCSDNAFQQNPDCQNLDYNLQMPRDGNAVSLGIVRTHLSHGHDIALDMHDRARSLAAGGLHPYPHTASMLHFFHSKVLDDLVKLNEESELTLFGTKLLQHKLSVDHNITPNNFLEFLNHHGFRVTGDRICRGRQKRCGGYDKFPSLDGSCNNVAHPTWGQSNRAFARILPARYSDGIHAMPLSVTGAELPNPRKLSIRLYSRCTKLDPELTLAVMQWGQTLAHDLGRQVMDQTTNGGIECCADNGKRHLPKSLQHHSCAPITISPRDKFYSIHGQRCMNFVRAMTVCREDCTLGPADQLNVATSFLDCSSMYGPDKSTSDELREFTGGRMKLEFRSGRWMLPTTTNQSNFCDIWTSDDVCYRTGDPRNNQNPQLVILQTMLVREHNRIADGLKALNPQWNDERIFQESRRIVIAEYQHITYNEWLPLLLGRRYVKKHGLNRTESEMSSAYNERVNPTTIIGFTSGAFRSLHSMIEGDIGLCNVGGEVTDSLRLSDHFFRPKVIEKKNNFEHLLRGLAAQHMQAQDMNFHRELTEYLFRSRNDYGMDLAAIDIQRGRDHGVPSYNAYRKICRLEPANDFDDLSEEISWANIEKLRSDYAHVDDIDLIVGATMENRAPGSLFGPTNRCLIGEQFYRSRVGDRYFYDNANLPHSFTQEQFHEITKVTLSRLMCDMGGAIVVIQRNAFRAISPKNPLVPCEDLPKMDLTLWME